MLNKLIILNSKVYGKAEISFDDIDSLQLVGPNNVGKSTLIYALNFLFVIDGSKMSFSGNRKGDKETIHHYFPNPNQSYIVFEIGKKRSYCIMLKRDADGELEYYEIDAPYSDSMFFSQDGGSARLLKFDEVKAGLSAAQIAYSPFNNKADVLHAVYRRGKQNDAVVWLDESVKTDGISNNFSKVYRYLINSKLINNKTLKDALIIADNREHETLNFSQKNKKDISDLLRINDGIKAIRSIQKDFEVFRETVQQYKAKTRIVSEYIFAFNQSYESTISDLDSRIIEKINDLSHQQNELDIVLKPREQHLNQQIGAKLQLLQMAESDLLDMQKKLVQIEAYGNLEFLQESLHNLDKKRKQLELQITRIESGRFSLDRIEQKLVSLRKSIEKLSARIANYDAQLIHSLSDKQEVRQLLYTLLSEELSSMSSDLILKKVKKTGQSMPLFDGEITLPEHLVLRELPSVDELRATLEQMQNEEQEYSLLQKTLENLQNEKIALQQIMDEISILRTQMAELASKPDLVRRIDEQKFSLGVMRSDKQTLENELMQLLEEIKEKQAVIQIELETRMKLDDRRELLRHQKTELENIGLEPMPFHTSEGLEQIYDKIQLHYKDREILKAGKDSKFDLLRYKIQYSVSDEDEFIRYVDEEIACISDKEKSIESLLQSISTQFANPAFTLFRRYQEFKEFITSKFNQKLSRIRISNIEDLRIEIVDNPKVISEIRKISAIQDFTGQMMFDFDQSENLQVLNQYLDSGKRIHFDELFDIELHLSIHGESKKVDLKNQVESDGTDRMIRLVIIMAIINRLALSDSMNRIALFIDEIGTIDEQNRPELVKFCREHHFIPIFAAPQAFDGFDKYYFIIRKAGKINVGERHAIRASYEKPAESFSQS
ncbi:MAG: hypothetical protein IAE67_05520 [Candidatus Competibacteraceae bacterium]|nr:hypothetical protein [Candidatus Competibacteraceae bacterium]